jgi:PAS domain S-box-containing protein
MKVRELTQQDMAALPCLHEGSNFRLHLQPGGDNKPSLLIKSLTDDAVELSTMRLVNEYRQTVNLHLAGVRRPHDQLLVEGQPALALEYVDGMTLRESHIRHRLGLIDNLQVAIALTENLEALHQHGVVHRNLAPEHVIVSFHELKLTLIGFGDAIAEEAQSTPPENDLSSSMLAYISPEQTGRINRQADHRADLYSLGAMLYEIFTGKPPFDVQDAAQLVYLHLARRPLAPYELNADIPRALSDLIMRLLAKNPDERYQSAYGVRVDLSEIEQQLQQIGEIEKITLGEADYSSNFALPEHIYGREMELETLRNAIIAAGTGQGNLVLISGQAGSGKSALVESLQHFTAEQGSHFILGLHESSQRHLPYAGLRQAYDKWIDLLLAEESEDLIQWRNTILEISGENAALLLDILPRLKLIIGAQPPAREVGPSLTQNRFQHLLRNFILASATKNQPLVLFLDNLQWADQATLALLVQLLPDLNTLPIVLVIAYRDDEVGPGHPLEMLLKATTANKNKAITLSLVPLKIDTINHFIADALNRDGSETRPLSQLVLEKSGGNPLFIRQLMHSLHDNGHLRFDQESRRWRWNIESARQQAMISSVASMMTEKISKLPESTLSLLALAACFDNRFLCRSLSELAEISESDLKQRLQPAIESGLLLTATPLEGDNQSCLEFTHDRVHQAAYALLPLKQRRLNHLEIGRRMLKLTPDEKLDDYIFEITDQFNEGFQGIKQTSERDRLVNLNLMAGRKARREAAYQAAIRYLSMGIGLLPNNRWENPDEPTLELFLEAIEAEYQSANFDRAELLSHEVLKHTSDLPVRLRVYELRILFLTAQNRNQLAIEAGLTALGEIGITLSEAGNNGDREELQKLAERVEDLAYLSPMQNTNHLAAMRIMKNLAAPAQRSNPLLLQSLIAKMVLISASQGNSPISAFAYGWYGALLCISDSDIDTGYRFGRLSLEILRQFPAAELSTQVQFLFNAYVRHWKEPVDDAVNQLQKIFFQGMETGDLEYTSLAAVHHCGYLFCTGAPLQTVHKRLQDYRQMIDHWRLPFQDQMISLWLQASANLTASCSAPTNLSGDYFDESNYLDGMKGETNDLLKFSLFFSKTMLQYLFGDYEAAVVSAKEAEVYCHSTLGLYYRISHSYFYALSLLALHAKSDDMRQAECLEHSAPLIARLHRWAALSPKNHSHKLALVEAEQARALGHTGRAVEHFNLAKKLAQVNGQFMDVAMVSEREAAFYSALGRSDIMGLSIHKALESYRSWGAIGKVNALERHYSSPALKEASLLDTSAVLKASHNLSQEVHLEQLLEKLMRIVIESAGAEQGWLIQNSMEGLIIQARGDLGGVETLQATAIEESSELPLSVINYVARTHNQVVLGNAHRDPTFGNDSYITTHQTRSLLCLPIIYQGKLTALLYLENNLAGDVFTLGRLELLKALTSQAAISIENATLYSELENKVAALRESEQRFRVIFDETFQFIGVLDLQGRVLRANRSALQFASVTIEDVFNKYFWETPWWNHSKKLQDKLKQAVKKAATGKLVRFEATHPSPDGQMSYVDFSIKPVIDDDGKVLLLIPEGRDITERKQAEQALLSYKERLEDTVDQRTQELKFARDEAEGANRAKSVFLANMSHELRTPLNAILGFSQMMQRDENLSKDQHETLNIINNSGEHLLKLINDVLEIAKIEAGKLQLEIAPFDLHTLVREVSDMMRLRAEQKGLKLELDQSSQFPRYIKTDEARLRQILVNLLSNAIKFTNKGKVAIRLGVKNNANNHLLIEVSDTGLGISKSDQKRLFEPFEQLHQGKMQVGTGLGLSIVQHTVKLMRGKISVKSHIGKGSVFHIELPLSEADESEIIKLSDQSYGEVIGLTPGQKRYRILIAEDQRDNQLLLVKLMKNIGMEVKVANNGEECVAIFKQWKPDLIWMDRRMPVMDGVEATRKIRRLAGGKQVKIVAVTASAFKEQEPELMDAGMDDYIRKPFLFNEIYHSLSQQLGLEFSYGQDVQPNKCVRTPLTTELLQTISSDERDELSHAVISLDSERINAIISRIAAKQPVLGQSLSQLANEFDYPTILRAIDDVSEKEIPNEK